MGTTNFLFSSVTQWCKKFKSGVDSVENAPHARRLKLQLCKKKVEKVTNLVATDARLTTRHIAKCIGISVGAADTILRHDLKMRRISARWLPHVVTKEHKLARVRITKQLLKQFPKYNNTTSRRSLVSYWQRYVHEVLVNHLGGLSLPRKSVVRSTDRPDMTLDVYRGRKTTIQPKIQQQYNNRSFANIISGDETWVHFYEPKRKIQNKMWAFKGGKRPCIAKCTMSIKKVMYVIFFTNQGPAIQIAIPKGKSVNARFYKGNVLHKLKKYFLSHRPATGLRGVRLFHDNVSSHKAVIVREYLK